MLASERVTAKDVTSYLYLYIYIIYIYITILFLAVAYSVFYINEYFN